MTTTQQLTKAERRAEARLQAAQLQAETEAKEKRTRSILWSIIGVALAGLFGLGFWLFSHGDNAGNEAVSFDPVPVAEVTNVPANTNAEGGIVINRELAATATADPNLPTIGIYLDYMCPACAAFEHTNFQALVDLAQSGEANVVLHPVAILDRASLNTAFSTRAAAAAAWVADHSPSAMMNFHDLLFSNQPRESSPGLSNAEIADLARQAGASEETATGIADGTAATTFGQWTTAVTHQAGTDPALINAASGGFGTPTITINGEVWSGNWQVPGALRSAVLGG